MFYPPEAPVISLDYTILFQIVNFLVCLFILKKLIIGPILEIIAKRQSINEGLTGEAQSSSEKAKVKVEQYEARLLKARADVAAQREALKAEGEKLAHAQTDKAGDDARAIRQDAAARMAEESAGARASLSGKVEGFAELAIGKMLGA